MSLISKECVELVKEFEGFYPNKYICPAGVWTIGYGTTKAKYVNKGTCTKAEATVWLMEELEEKATAIKKNLDGCRFTLKQNEFDSLVSMAYNIGTGGLLGSTLYRNVLAGIKDKATITANFQAWGNVSKCVNGKNIMVPLEGLMRRRTEEAKMFLKSTDKKSVDYCEEFQIFFNKVTQTGAPLTLDGYGPKTEEAYKKLGKLIKGEY